MTLAAIDWAQPWFAPYRAIGEAAAQKVWAGDPVADALQQFATPGRTPAFVPQSALPPDRAYEAHVFQTRSVPTRDNLHDFFNGLVWLVFPDAKRRLNELQAAEIARLGIGATRGPLRDALTLFDENGALLDAPAALWQALCARDWHALFVARRALWREARLVVFGHALLEKLAAPRKASDRACAAASARRVARRRIDRRRPRRRAARAEALRAAAGAGRAGLVRPERGGRFLRRSEGLPPRSVELLLLSSLYPPAGRAGRFQRTQDNNERKAGPARLEEDPAVLI
ncbi:hypothetical protein M2165_002647 [Variovorax sp. TBS-050B]|nr:hypothetical protein [Variovorax sp. TBS-050B]